MPSNAHEILLAGLKLRWQNCLHSSATGLDELSLKEHFDILGNMLNHFFYQRVR